jgi:hypothetical protein
MMNRRRDMAGARLLSIAPCHTRMFLSMIFSESRETLFGIMLQDRG